MYYIQMITGIDIYGEYDPKFYYSTYEELIKDIPFFFKHNCEIKIGIENEEEAKDEA